MFLVGESLAQETKQLVSLLYSISFLYKEGSQLRLNESVILYTLFTFVRENKQTKKKTNRNLRNST